MLCIGAPEIIKGVGAYGPKLVVPNHKPSHRDCQGGLLIIPGRGILSKGGNAFCSQPFSRSVLSFFFGRPPGAIAVARRRKHYRKPRPRRGAAKTEASKAKSLQSSWRKATDRTGTLPIEEARAIVANPPDCPYCSKKIHYKEISIDHVEARSRGGSSEPSNLVYACRRCNTAKGDLSGVEFKALMAFLITQTAPMRESILSRLIAGGAKYGRRRRR